MGKLMPACIRRTSLLHHRRRSLMPEPLISVIVPVYNAELYIRRCVDSLRQQTYKNLELILVDDGSPDESGSICVQYAEQDPRIRVIRQPNQGVSAARNEGREAASGTYVTFVDVDDYIDPRMIETMYTAAENGADIVICGHNRVEEDGRIHCDSDVWPDVLDTAGIQKSILRNTIPNFCWGKLFRRSLWEWVRFPRGMIFEDLFIMPTVFCKARHIEIVREPLYFYSNQNKESLMNFRFGKTYVLNRYGLFLAWEEHERLAHRYSPECEEEAAGKAIRAGVRAYSMSRSIHALTPAQEQHIREYVFLHRNMPLRIQRKYKWQKWLMFHFEPLLVFQGTAAMKIFYFRARLKSIHRAYFKKKKD